MKLNIEYVNIDEIKKYKNNAKKHTEEQIEQIKKSIENFEMIDPIGIWKNEIVEGHGRYIACKELGYKEIPIIRLDHLTDEQRKAYNLVHNQLTLNTGYDIEKLTKELDEIKTIDMQELGFDIEESIVINVSEEKENQRERTNNSYNLELFDKDLCDGKYQMPIIENDRYIPDNLIGFNFAKTSKEKNCGIHFYIDDYQFERIWNTPADYVEILSQYKCMLTPDFSLYIDMPFAMKIWNVYRSRLIGQYYQQQGIKVIPTISWAERETFEFCFDGILKHSIVSISTIGVKKTKEAYDLWKEGVDELIKRIEPETIIVYGGKLDYDFKDINVIYFDNSVTERMKGD